MKRASIARGSRFVVYSDFWDAILLYFSEVVLEVFFFLLQ